MHESHAEAGILSNEDLPAAFWDALPEKADHPDLLAINALKDESTQQEQAEALKEQGNDAFKRAVQLEKVKKRGGQGGKPNPQFFLREAVTKYTAGIEVCPKEEPRLLAVLLSNRAQCHLKLGNNRTALKDCYAALGADSHDSKIYFRAATAAFRLGELEEARRLCASWDRGCGQQSPEILQLKQEVEARIVEVETAKTQQAARRVVETAPARKLARTMLKRGWRVGLPQISVGPDITSIRGLKGVGISWLPIHQYIGPPCTTQGLAKPFLDKDGGVVWPLVLLFPEFGQSDKIEQVPEGTLLSEQLDDVYGPGSAPIPWDVQGEYTRERLRLFYLSNAAKPLQLDKLTEVLYGGWPENTAAEEPERHGKLAARLVQVPEGETLGSLLSRPDYVVPGVPLFFVVSHGTKYEQRFLEQGYP